jgi:hypothetical protein
MTSGPLVQLREKIEFQMIPKECKRLAVVDFPIAMASKHAARVSIEGFISAFAMRFFRR